MKKRTIVYNPDTLNPMARMMLKDQRVSVIVENFLGVDWHKQTKVFPNFVICKNPKDFPDKFTVRLFDGKQPTRLVAVKDTLEEARATVPKIFYKVPRSEKDDPIIVETWL